MVTEVHIPETAQRRRSGFHRAELLQVLYEAIRKNPNIRMHVNKRLVKVEKLSDEEMKLEFHDGTTATANLVIGADGIHSVVRSHYLNDEPIFSGIVAYRGLIPMEKVREFWPFDDSDVSGFWTQQGKHFMTYLILSHSQLIADIRFRQMDEFLISLHLHRGTRIRQRKSLGFREHPKLKSLKYTRIGILWYRS